MGGTLARSKWSRRHNRLFLQRVSTMEARRIAPLRAYSDVGAQHSGPLFGSGRPGNYPTGAAAAMVRSDNGARDAAPLEQPRPSHRSRGPGTMGSGRRAEMALVHALEPAPTRDLRARDSILDFVDQAAAVRTLGP